MKKTTNDDTRDIAIDDVCPKCNQYPYSEKENNCPVCFEEIGECFEEIGECFDDDISNVMDKYIKKGFVSKKGNMFFEDDEILDSFEYHIKGLLNLIKMTHKEKK